MAVPTIDYKSGMPKYENYNTDGILMKPPTSKLKLISYKQEKLQTQAQTIKQDYQLVKKL